MEAVNRAEAARAEELVLELREERDQLRSRTSQLAVLQAQVDSAHELREAAEDVAQLEVERAKTMAFDLEMARDALTDEKSRVRLKDAELSAKAEHIKELLSQMSSSAPRVAAQQAADELHERVRVAAVEGAEARRRRPRARRHPRARRQRKGRAD